jgi:hypothetical protein
MDRRSNSLEQYAAEHPQQEPEQIGTPQTINPYREREQLREQAAQAKASIMQQLEQGNAPQTVLYTAITAIGQLTHDPQWAAAATQILDSVFEDLAQQSLLTDNAAVAAQRLDTMQAEYIGKLRRQLQRSQTGYKRLEKALQEALQAVNAIEPQEPEETT